MENPEQRTPATASRCGAPASKMVDISSIHSKVAARFGADLGGVVEPRQPWQGKQSLTPKVNAETLKFRISA